MENLTFEQLPNAIHNLTQRVIGIEKLLQQQAATPATETTNELLNVSEAANFLDLAVPTVYSMVSRGELPYMKKTKRIYFSKSELLEYLKTGRKSTNKEIQENAAQYLIKRKGGKNE